MSKQQGDMLVRLYDFHMDRELIRRLEEEGIVIRRAIAPEKHECVAFAATFSKHWESECDVAFSNHPATCFIAVKDGKVAGFACVEATCKDFFGPTGVSEEQRGKGIGKALLHISLQELKNMGYAYAVIGDPGPVEFYQKTCGAFLIPDSVPGIYKGML